MLEKLEGIFGYDIKTKLRKVKNFNEKFKVLKGPLDMANHQIIGILKKAPVEFVTKLIESQFQIKWNTPDGIPQRFNFYDFCDVEKQDPAKTPAFGKKKGEGETVHLKYFPRRAHVFTELYREREKVVDLKLDKYTDCVPDVYVKVKGRYYYGWVKISLSTEKCEKIDFEKEFAWMNEELRNFVKKVEEVNLETKNVDYSTIEPAIERPNLYWAVLDDSDFKPGKHLKLNKIGKTQVYVGKANNGIMGRWLKDADSHSKKIMKCKKGIGLMKKSFDITRVEDLGLQLVDARLLLAKARGDREKCALFVIKAFEEGKTKELGKLETNHRNGKTKYANVNIVPLAKVKDTWTPKKMEFGMNFN